MRCSTSPQSNSESLPDLKLTPRTSRRAHHIQQKVKHTMRSVVGHSLSDPALVRVLSGRNFRDEESTKMKDLASISPSPLMDRLINDGLADSSLSDCSEQSGWVSSAVSSRHSDVTPPHTHFCNDESPYPELEPIPLAPPEEFQVSYLIIIFLLYNVFQSVNYYINTISVGLVQKFVQKI